MKTALLLSVTVAGLFATTANAGLQFYATNNLADANFGTGGDTLIIFDFNTANWASVGLINVGGNPIDGGFGGLDWAGAAGSSPLIGAVSFGTQAGEMYTINTSNGNAVFIGTSPVAMHDLALNRANGKMYGTDSADGLWRDDNGDSIPETFVGNYGIGALEVGLGFDGAGNVYVHDLLSDMIYRGVGDNPASVAMIVALPFDSNFSQGLYVGDDRGYHGALDGGTTTSPNYSFALDGSDYTFMSQFATHGPTGLPEVEVGDLTPVPTPGALALLVLAGLAARRRPR